MPSKNQIILDALSLWIDQNEGIESDKLIKKVKRIAFKRQQKINNS